MTAQIIQLKDYTRHQGIRLNEDRIAMLVAEIERIIDSPQDVQEREISKAMKELRLR